MSLLHHTFNDRSFIKSGLFFLLALFAASLILAMTAPRQALAAGFVVDCVNFGPGAGTLQDALVGGGTVKFACNGTIIIPSRVVISQNTSLEGTGQSVILSGNNNAGLFFVNPGVSLNIKNLTLTKGNDPISGGGAIFSNGGAVELSNSVLSFNNGSNGGAIYNRAGKLNVTFTTLIGNIAQLRGGAIFNTGGSSLTSSKNLFQRNSSQQEGGAIYNSGQQVEVSNTTFAYNSSAKGGAVFHNWGTFIMTNNTLAQNSAGDGNGGSLYNNAPSSMPLKLTNTIIANPLGGGNCAGNPIVNGGSNLQFPALSCGAALTSANPLLKSLANNGGPTQTMGLSLGSPAIDQGNNPVCAAFPVSNHDQRDFVRPVDGNGDGMASCDIGAFEL